MKRLSLILGLACIIPAALADDYSCVRDDPQLPTSAYRLRESLDWDLSDLHDHFAASNKVVSVSNVLGAANHQLVELNPDTWTPAMKVTEKPQSVYRWESTTEGFDDFGTTKWVPQGITSSSDALNAGEWEGKNVWLVSWHNADDSSVRLTFIDKDTGKYRHALLVVPNTEELYSGPVVAASDFGPLGVHAGGIMWYGDTLWVVDTHKGLRVFDMNNIWEVDIGDNVGKDGDKFTAQSYRYVIPQIRTYTFEPSRKMVFSFVSLDREGTDSLMVGEFVAGGTSASVPIRLVKWKLDYTNRKLHTTSQVATSSWAYCVNINDMQGAVSHGPDKFYISTSNTGRGIGDLWTWNPGSLAKKHTGFLPPGPEDLTYDNITQTFSTVTEYNGGRFIVTYDAFL